MPRRAARADANQEQVVRWFRALGASVAHIHTVGQGVPDLLVGWRGYNLLVEVKQPKGRLTPDETTWHETWLGQVAIIRTLEDVQELLERYE